MTCCCPCITFGKTHHRLTHNGDMTHYSAVNGSCLIWLGLSYVALGWVPQLLQKNEVRTKFNLQGEGVADCLKAACCGCCDLIQMEKESEQRVGLLSSNVVNEQPAMKQDAMAYNANAHAHA